MNATSPRNARAGRSPTTLTLMPFVRQKTVLLTAYRRDGTPVGTPVHVAVEGDRAFLRTWHTTGKRTRERTDPEVEISPSTLRGKPTGRTIRARARILDGEEARDAARNGPWD